MMTGAVVFQSETVHVCRPPCGGPMAHMLYPRGTVWRCDCDWTWVSLGLHLDTPHRRLHESAAMPASGLRTEDLQHGPFRGGYEALALGWKREGHRARRRRELAETCP